jgi:hypothetical protein
MGSFNLKFQQPIFNQTIEYSIQFIDDKGHGIDVDGSHIIVETDGLVFFNFIGGETDGMYTLHFEAPSPGTYFVLLTIRKPNYAPQSIKTTIHVDPIPMINKKD